MFISAGKATIITIGGLAAGAVVGSVVENWLQVDIVPFLGIHSKFLRFWFAVKFVKETHVWI